MSTSFEKDRKNDHNNKERDLFKENNLSEDNEQTDFDLRNGENQDLMEQGSQEVVDMKKPMNIKNEIFSWVAIALLAYLLANFITNYVIIKAVIPSDSMENTIMTGDKIIGNRLAYLFTTPKRGDIVIFKFPDDETKDYIKRIIGLPGETVEIKDESVYIYDADGTLIEGPLNEPYLKEVMYTEGVQTFTIPKESYFMMGDNRNISDDARYWTNSFVHIDKILGKAWLRYRPNIGFIE